MTQSRSFAIVRNELPQSFGDFCQYHLISSAGTWTPHFCQWIHKPGSGAPLIRVALYKFWLLLRT